MTPDEVFAAAADARGKLSGLELSIGNEITALDRAADAANRELTAPETARRKALVAARSGVRDAQDQLAVDVLGELNDSDQVKALAKQIGGVNATLTTQLNDLNTDAAVAGDIATVLATVAQVAGDLAKLAAV